VSGIGGTTAGPGGGTRAVDPRVGTTLFDRFRVIERLGQGGMGVVYRARDLTLDADIALKVLASMSDEASERLRAEVRFARRVTHPNVCRIHDVIESPGLACITMEWIDGESLATRLSRGRPTRAEAFEILRGVIAGLAAAHAAGIIHRDLKPSNVLLAHDGRVVVADFGIATERDAPQTLAGTLGYMAPEQAMGKACDARADVYSFGVLATVVLAGVRPPAFLTHATDTPLGGGSAHALTLDDRSDALARLPAHVRQLVARCLEPEPQRRPDNAGEVEQQLRPSRSRARRFGLVALGIASIGLAAVVARPEQHEVTRAVAIGAIATDHLRAEDRFLGPIMDRLIENELADGWNLDRVATDAVHPILEHDGDGSLRLQLGTRSFASRDPHTLAIEVARALAGDVRAPSDALLADAGTRNAEAWRWWRRAQRESEMERWQRATELAAKAISADPDFALAHLEMAMVYDAGDPVGVQAVAAALNRLDRAPVGPAWQRFGLVMHAANRGDTRTVKREAAVLLMMTFEPRTRAYFEYRKAIADYVSDPRAAIAELAFLAEHAADPAPAIKLLAEVYVDSDDPTAAASAGRWVVRALVASPDDAAVRALAGTAALRAGDSALARTRAREIAQLPSDDQRLARRRLFELHMGLGDIAEAEADARRELSGGIEEQSTGRGHLALLELANGELAGGLATFEEAATATDRMGLTKAAAVLRLRLALAAWRLGDLATARDALERVAHSKTVHVPFAAAALAALRDDGGAVDALPRDSREYLFAATMLAIRHHRDRDVLALSEKWALASVQYSFALDRATALGHLGQVEAARDELTTFVRDARNFSQPVDVVLAWAKLGELAATRGDASTAYGEVIKRWGSAALRPEVVKARAYLNGR
jgi:tetratricopeptide (TPR) repeat protein/predicted Ser/Thr protein kinase